jgi:hypothetical protein
MVTTFTGSHEAHLIDISQTGARLSGNDLPNEGDELILVVETVRAFGCVAWKHDDECGIAFDGPLPAMDIEILRHKAARGSGLTPYERAAFEDWTLGLAR